ncbi:MAG TPA: hypothetical protein PK281_09500 [Flavobacteriales bacterium]|nr:hypothetical protein [Flavobacteriales bacterium]
MNFKSLSGLFLLLVFCLRFLPSLEMHDHRTDRERCMQEHSDHRDQFSSCELTDALGWDFSGHCSDKNHIKESNEECASCGFDFIKNFESSIGNFELVTTIDYPERADFISSCYSGFTLLLCNKGPPSLT